MKQDTDCLRNIDNLVCNQHCFDWTLKHGHMSLTQKSNLVTSVERSTCGWQSDTESGAVAPRRHLVPVLCSLCKGISWVVLLLQSYLFCILEGDHTWQRMVYELDCIVQDCWFRHRTVEQKTNDAHASHEMVSLQHRFSLVSFFASYTYSTVCH